jgi:hypothetical protein
MRTNERIVELNNQFKDNSRAYTQIYQSNPFSKTLKVISDRNWGILSEAKQICKNNSDETE